MNDVQFSKTLKTHQPRSHDEGERIGPYRLRDKLGQGGMGEVWLAEQRQPVQRQVALKLIKPGMDTQEVVARFEAERQALAMMDHPAIATVYDAGATPNGRPYFAMELVKGVPITDYCDNHKLTNQERLTIFLKVCEGVQYAHHKAVIHRDLKPGNVLVSVQQDTPVPKIIDFGVAKATGQTLTSKTLHTQLGMIVGTPAYMSPEQAEMTTQDIDTRTDVYALGVMLYQLLVGALPFDTKALLEGGYEAMVRRIRENEPPRLSTKLTTMGRGSTASAQKRRTGVGALQRELTGDLDWITLKALEKDRTRRYSSPYDLARDIERHLNDEPVLASPPSVAYRAQKFVKRHTVGVAAAAAAVLVLIAFAGTMTVQAGRIAAERDRANREAETRGQVSAFMTDLFRISDPGEARGNSITARELLDTGAEKIMGMLTESPELRADLMATIGEVFTNLGLYREAEALLEQALSGRQRGLGDDHQDTLRSLNSLASLYSRQGRYNEAEPLYLETIATQQRVLGNNHRNTLGTLHNLASLYVDQGRYDEAEPLYLETLAIQQRVLGNDHPDTLVSINNLASLYEDLGQYNEAEPLYLETLAVQQRVLGNDHPDTLVSMNNLASLYEDLGQYDEAEPLYLETLAVQQRVLGNDHPDTLVSMNNLASLYEELGHYDEAETLYLETLAVQQRVLGGDHPDTGITLHNLAFLYRDTNRYAESQSLFEQALTVEEKVFGVDHPQVAGTLLEYAALLRQTDDVDGAERLKARARAIYDQ